MAKKKDKKLSTCWIRVDKALPSEEEDVLCFGNSQVFIGYYDPHMGWHSNATWHNLRSDFEPITHWTLLPEAPNETI